MIVQFSRNLEFVKKKVYTKHFSMFMKLEKKIIPQERDRSRNKEKEELL